MIAFENQNRWYLVNLKVLISGFNDNNCNSRKIHLFILRYHLITSKYNGLWPHNINEKLTILFCFACLFALYQRHLSSRQACNVERFLWALTQGRLRRTLCSHQNIEPLLDRNGNQPVSLVNKVPKTSNGDRHIRMFDREK